MKQRKYHLAAIKKVDGDLGYWTACGLLQWSVQPYESIYRGYKYSTIVPGIDRPIDPASLKPAPAVIPVDCGNCLRTKDAWSLRVWLKHLPMSQALERRQLGAYSAKWYLEHLQGGQDGKSEHESQTEAGRAPAQA